MKTRGTREVAEQLLRVCRTARRVRKAQEAGLNGKAEVLERQLKQRAEDLAEAYARWLNDGRDHPDTPDALVNGMTASEATWRANGGSDLCG